MKTYVFILSAFILTLLASCEKPSANLSSSQSSTQFQNLQKDTTIQREVKIEESTDSEKEMSRIRERIASGEPDYAANILGYWEPGTKTEAFEESYKWQQELFRLMSTPKLMTDHGYNLTSQQLKDLQAKATEAMEQLIYWDDVRINELTKKVDELKKSGDTIKAQVYELEIKQFEQEIEMHKTTWQKINLSWFNK